MPKSTKHTINVAAAEKFGTTAKHEYIIEAIELALKQVNVNSASSVLLFLTNGYTHMLNSALRLAAKTAGTIQVYGSTAAGLLSHNHWILDQEGAVVMIFPSECDLQPVNLLTAQNNLNDANPILCFSSPEHCKLAINYPEWCHLPMLGAVTSNAYGVSSYPIWQSSRTTKSGFIHLGFNTKENFNLTAHTIVSQGVRRISANLIINTANANCISEVNDSSPITSLQRSIPKNIYPLFLEQPYHALCAISENEQSTSVNNDNKNIANALNKGFYHLCNIIGIDEAQESIYISGKVKEQQQCFWALRDNLIAKQEWELSLQSLQKEIECPVFAMLFCNESRGPYFHGDDDDTDLALFKQYFPGIPLIGFYSSAEISPGSHYQSLLRRYSSVLTIYSQ